MILMLLLAAAIPTMTVTVETRCPPAGPTVAGCTADWRPATAVCSGELFRIRVRGREGWVCAKTDKGETIQFPGAANPIGASRLASDKDVLLLDPGAEVWGAPDGDVVYHLFLFEPRHDKGNDGCRWTDPDAEMELRIPHVDCPVRR